MSGLIKNKIGIIPLEKRLMLDASLGALISSTVLAEDTVNASPQILDADVSVTGTTTDFTGEDLTISTDGGATEQLSFNNEGTGAGQIGIAGTVVSYEGTTIGTITSDGTNGNDLIVSLNANASKAAIERLVENLAYQNTSDAPAVSRTLNVALGAFFSEDVDITIVAQNDDLVLNTNGGATVAEAGTVTITSADLNVTDVDDVDTDLVFSVTSTVTNGRLELSTNTGVAITSFTMDDIINNRVQYVHDDSDTTSDSFNFTVTDGDTTLPTETFSITINAVNDPLAFDANAGVTVFQGFSTVIGAEGTQFGNEILRFNSTGNYGTWDGTIDNNNLQFAMVFTTPGANPTDVPGQTLFESGGAGVGVGLYLNSNFELDFYAGSAQNTPRLSSDALSAGTQYAVVVEIDQDTNQIRMHYQQTSDLSWYTFGRAAEKTLNGYTSTDHSGGNGSGFGQNNSSTGGYNGSVSGSLVFQGSIDSDLVITQFPASSETNTMLSYTDTDTSANNIIYTITTDVTNGTIKLNGVDLGLGDTFSQADLDLGRVTYQNSGGLADSFDYSVTDGDTVLTDTFVITINTNNTAPEIYEATTILDEDFEGGTSGWNNNTTTTSTELSEFWGRFNRNINVSGNQELYQTFATTGTQDYIVVEFDFYELDSWDNEYFYIFVDDTNILGSNHRFHMNTYDQESSGTNGNVSYSIQETSEQLGYIDYTYNRRDQTYHYTLVIQSSDPTVKLGFGSSLNGTNLNDESFGIDNLKITELSRAGTDSQEFYLAEDVANGDTVGTLLAVEDNVGQSITYSVTGGTGSAIFSIDASTGEITVTDNSTLDYETGPNSYTLDIQVTDGVLIDTQTITINLMDVLENTAPNVTFTQVNLAEDAANGTVVGTLPFTDGEGDGIELWQITNGNELGIFSIDAATGQVTLTDNSYINFENENRYDIRIRAWDDNALGLYRDQTLRVNITDVDDAPSFDPEFIGENSGANIIYSSATGNFYRFVDSNANYATAKANAESAMLNGAAGHLLTIESNAEKAFINSISDQHLWLGISDEGTEGVWRYTSGPNAGLQLWQGTGASSGGYATNGFFTDWRGNAEPNSGGGADGAIFYNNDGRWVDASQNNNYRYVIEWEGPDVVNNDTYYVNYDNPADLSDGDAVGTVQGLDPDGDTLTYTVTGGTGSALFAIDPTTGAVTISNAAGLDPNIDYTLTVRATEDNGANQFAETTITIILNENLSLDLNNGHAATEGQASIINPVTDLTVTDNDGVATDIIFDIDTFPANGQLELTTNPGTGIITFTLDDLNNNRVQYVHDGTETTTDSFTFTVTDGGQTLALETFNISITPVNDAPTVATNTGAPVTEGGNVTITNAMLDALDIDDAATGLTYTASAYNNGHIEVSGTIQNTFTQDDIDNNRVVFVHDGNEGATNFAFSLADGGEDSATAATGTFNFTVTAVNDTPLITTNTGASVVEGDFVTVTTAMLNVTDPDDSGTGLTYTLSNIINGQVVLSTAPGTPVLSFTQADLNANRVRFVHDGGENDARFDISVEDGGEDGAVADTATFNLTRIPVNDAPTIGVNAGSSVNQNSIVLLKRSVLAASDPDDSGTGLTFTITGTANGQLEYLSNPNVAITSFTQDDIDNSRVVFRHSGATAGTYFDFTIADGGEDSAGTASGRFNLTVDNINDAPTIATNVGPTVNEGSTTVLTNAMLDSFDPDDFGTGLTWTASNLVNGIIQVSGVTQNSFTQADLDAGIVTFIHDGSETITAGFDIQVADGGENGALPDTDTFTMTVTPVNDATTLVVNDGSPNVVDFNDYTIDPYGGSQDAYSTVDVSADGTTLTITDANAWKKIDIPYTLTPNTVLSFEFFTDTPLEVQGIGFENDAGFGFNGYQLTGTQNWGVVDHTYDTYDAGDGWVRFDIPIGADFTGAMNSIVFAIDNDANISGATSIYRNLNFYEADQVVEVDEGGTFNITSAHITSVDPDDSGTGITYTASNITNGVVQVSGVTTTTFTQDDIDNNRVTFVHDGSDTLNAGFDISVVDGGEDGATADTGSFTLVVNPVNDAPVIATNTGATMDEGANLTITTAMLNEVDPDDDGAQLPYTASNLTNGHIEVSGVTTTSFTQDDIDQGRVVFVHDDSQTVAASFDFSLADGGEDAVAPATGTFNITVTPVNDNVVVATNTGANITESGTVTVTNTMLNATDVDDTAADTVFTITDIENGWVELTTKTGFPVTSFTQDDIDNNRVVFRHDGSGSGAAEFDFSVVDGGEDGTTAVTGTFAVTVNTPVNEGATIAISDGTPSTVDFGTAVISPYDPSGAGDGQGATPTDYEVSTDGTVLTLYGNSWKKIPMPMTLTSDTVLTFDFRSTKEGEIHGIGFETDDSITNGSYSYELFGTDANGLFNQAYNTYNLGDGWTRFEIPIGADFTGAVTDLFFMADDDAGADAISQFRNVTTYEANPTVTMLEGGSVTITNANLNALDTDDNAAGVTYTASALTNGHIEVSGVTTTSFTQADIDNGDVVFVHDGSETVAASFNISLADGLENGAIADTATFSIDVTPQNDSSTIATNTGATLNEGASLTITNTMLDSSDPDDAASDRTYTVSGLTNGHIEVSGVTATSFTQDDIDNNRVVFIHDGSETTAASFNISLADGLEHGAFAATGTFNMTVNPVNDAPTAIGMTNAEISEDAGTGTEIGDIYATDVDLPGDVFTYTIMSDPDSKFAIVGNKLMLNASLDYESATLHTVTIRANDNNGAFIDRVMTITVLDVNEFTFTAPPTTGRAGGDGGPSIVIEEERARREGASLLEAFLSGDEFAQINAFYGEGGFGQVLRENTTVEIREMILGPQANDPQDPVQEAVEPLVTPTAEAEAEVEAEYTNIREMLEAIQQFENEDPAQEGDGEEGEEGDQERFHNLYDQFEDVLTYHEQRKAKLREALSS